MWLSKVMDWRAENFNQSYIVNWLCIGALIELPDENEIRFFAKDWSLNCFLHVTIR